jgi:hypothetical protein
VIGRPLGQKNLASHTNADLPDLADHIDHQPLPGRPAIFRRITSCSISLSR